MPIPLKVIPYLQNSGIKFIGKQQRTSGKLLCTNASPVLTAALYDSYAYDFEVLQAYKIPVLLFADCYDNM